LKTLLLFPLLCGGVSADEASDRTAIAHSIAALNEIPQPAALFTVDSRAEAAIEDLGKGKRKSYRLSSLTRAQSGQPSMTISHEP
jgi:hypothetical protein